MQVCPLSTVEQLDAIAASWNRLADGVPMRGHDWLAGWARAYVADLGRPLVLSVWCGDALVGLAPWRLAASGGAIHWLGDGEVCTDHLTLLADAEHRAEVSHAVADWLVEHREDWSVLDLDHSDADDPVMAGLMDALADRGCPVQEHQDDACWTIDLPADWEAFLARQSKSHRKQLRRAERRVLESDGCNWRAVRTQEELEVAWPIFTDLHQRRRVSLGEPGCFASQRFTQFHRALSRRLLASGNLRMSWLELDGQPAAAEYHFCCGEKVYAYQGGVDPDRLEDEPGRLSNIATIKDAIALGNATFDFLRGDEPYKAHWRAVARPTLRRRVASPRGGAMLRARAGWAADSFKQRLRDGFRSVTGPR